jgi:hypothetical protein
MASRLRGFSTLQAALDPPGRLHPSTAPYPIQTTPPRPPTRTPSYDELTAHERIQVGGTKGGITTKEGGYTGHYEGEGAHLFCGPPARRAAPPAGIERATSLPKPSPAFLARLTSLHASLPSPPSAPQAPTPR